MSEQNVEFRYRGPLNDPASRGATPPVYRKVIEHGMIVEYDVGVKMRDGVTIYVDVYRPLDEVPSPPLIAWGPYGKHVPNEPLRFPGAGINPEHISTFTPFEGPDPAYWVPRHYVVVTVNPRGTWYSEGKASYLTPAEAEDFYDLIEWAGVQPWSSGKVGMTGVSYLAQTQWRVADLNPPHLAAMNPWEGWSDTYREVTRHGGIPETHFWPYIWQRWGGSTTEIEDLGAETAEHPLFDAYWETKAATFTPTQVPAFIVASWSDQGLHTRGTLEGFKKIGSKQKWLDIQGRKKWAYYYEPESVARLNQFFDHFLKGIGSLDDWPKVRYHLREHHYVHQIKSATAWPPAETRYTKLYLDAASHSLSPEPVKTEAEAKYEATVEGSRAVFDIAFTEQTDLVGYMKLKLFISAQDTDDADIFVAVQKLDKNGEFVPFPYYAQFEDGPMAVGWLRASHRELDPMKSTEYQPVLKHERELKLQPGGIVPVEIEIWPSGTRFEAGEKLRLVIQGSDINKYPKETAWVYFRHEDSVNHGAHVVHTGGKYESYLLVPVIPAK